MGTKKKKIHRYIVGILYRYIDIYTNAGVFGGAYIIYTYKKLSSGLVDIGICIILPIYIYTLAQYGVAIAQY